MIKIIKAVEGDIPQISEIELEAIAPPWSHESLISEIRMEGSYFAVAGTCVGNDAVESFHLQGFVILRRMGSEGELLQIAVDKKARCCGIGGFLMDSALGYASENSIRPVFLEVRKSNKAAIALYEKHGFKFLRLRKGYYNNPTEDAMVMVYNL